MLARSCRFTSGPREAMMGPRAPVIIVLLSTMPLDYVDMDRRLVRMQMPHLPHIWMLRQAMGSADGKSTAQPSIRVSSFGPSGFNVAATAPTRPVSARTMKV